MIAVDELKRVIFMHRKQTLFHILFHLQEAKFQLSRFVATKYF